MQLIPRYLYNNKMVLVSNLAGDNTEFRQVYTRNIKIHRGIDNTILFEIKNGDQKPVSILNTYTPKFTMFDENKTQVLTKTGTIKETSTPLYKGQFTVTVSENDLLNVKEQFCSYNVYMVATSGDKTLTYANTHYGAKGVIKVEGDAFPGPADTYNLKTFTETGVGTDIYVSETITAEPAKNGNEALHTAAVYSTDFTGDVLIQATLDNTVSGSTYWGTVGTLALSNPSTPKYINFNGVYNHLRVQYTKTNGTIDKVLVRN